MAKSPILDALRGAGGELRGDLLTQTLQRYKRLRKYSNRLDFRSSPRDSTGRGSEFYPPGEGGSFSPRRHAIETFGPGSTPSGIAGEIVSHWLAHGTDPVLTRGYNQFVSSLTPFQHSVLHEQYRWDQKHYRERRPFKAWATVAGLPAYYRGEAFHQWPQTEKIYTRAQRAALDRILPYLRGSGG